ncbi:protein rhomboid isoform X1 [Diorhabda sublineata]|uniref:protein rhomboid isoform X1 n=1 Tax=Diorhabda sublineata TaxID=1163346 RepID=UPI0024E16934|nr:protein rhomboid isoform X1 [Diorhabda sublineata]XP_056647007.1 protein rhomboid isoform X1 [Diorhabda sublineata]XP_056647008.1 protein rhomboid isoform X1 [Diorhabda sublineata]XP_056647009.1 protein rhomboid isoform X1 [Diorhabda sublineata]XP_056647010.1 protein rhomboid isoform X1 [Diorhabda sublineata]XP_056647011.1 protein rhomboid isoform X1 [Diorhabda sublineata]
MSDKSNNNYASSSATTPEYSAEEEKFLVPYQISPKFRKKWFCLKNTPFGILIVSLIQLLIHVFATANLQKALRFEPDKRIELWRFFTYMLIHDGWYHFVLNIIIQCIFAVLLEKRQGHIRVLILYFLGGFTGVLGASCVHPDLVIGASAGVYALLISNIPDIILNYSRVNYKIYRLAALGVLVLFDIIYNIVHIYSKKEPVISWEAHCVGGVSGLLLGFMIYKYDDMCQSITINRTLFWISVIFYSFMVICFVILTIQIKKCTPSNIIHFRYIYVC